MPPDSLLFVDAERSPVMRRPRVGLCRLRSAGSTPRQPPQGARPAGTNIPAAPSLSGVGLRRLSQDLIQVEGGRLLARGELGETADLVRHNGLTRVQNRRVIDHPIPVGVGVEIGALKRVATQAEDVRYPQFHQRLRPDVHLKGTLYGKLQLPVTETNRHELPVITEVDQRLPRTFLHFAGEVRQHVVAIEMDVEGLIADLRSLEQSLRDVQVAGGRQQGGKHINVTDDAVEDRASLDLAGPADEGRYPPAAFPVGVLLAAEWRRGAIRPGVVLRSVVG